MPKRRRVSEDVVRVPLLPNFAQTCHILLARAVSAGRPSSGSNNPLNDDEVEGLDLLRSAINEALVEYLRGGRP